MKTSYLTLWLYFVPFSQAITYLPRNTPEILKARTTVSAHSSPKTFTFCPHAAITPGQCFHSPTKPRSNMNGMPVPMEACTASELFGDLALKPAAFPIQLWKADAAPSSDSSNSNLLLSVWKSERCPAVEGQWDIWLWNWNKA